MIDWSKMQTAEQKVSDLRDEEARSYLASTNWYVIREQEIGEPIPQDVKDKRRAAWGDLKGGF